LNSFIKFWLHPFNIFWLLFLAGLAAYFLKKEKVSITIFILAGIWLLITSNFLLPNFLITKLENKFSPFTKDVIQNDSVQYNIVVLGAGFSNNKRLPYNDQLSSTALSRLIEGIRIHNLLPNSKMVVSGPGFNGGISQAEVFSKTAASLGVDTSVISTIQTATNTQEEAKAYALRFDKNIPVILVTSASHMPRAMMMFKSQGITPIPAPTDFQSKGTGESTPSWVPSAEYMGMMKTAMIEYVGILYAQWFLL
jgi:uncharacterized SAM-binding protein YcdF (DUF218 family)